MQKMRILNCSKRREIGDVITVPRQNHVDNV